MVRKVKALIKTISNVKIAASKAVARSEGRFEVRTRAKKDKKPQNPV